MWEAGSKRFIPATLSLIPLVVHMMCMEQRPAKIAAMIQRLRMAECEVVSSRRSVSYYEVNNIIVAHRLETSLACRM
jgi:hypothetical protein